VLLRLQTEHGSQLSVRGCLVGLLSLARVAPLLLVKDSKQSLLVLENLALQVINVVAALIQISRGLDTAI